MNPKLFRFTRLLGAEDDPTQLWVNPTLLPLKRCSTIPVRLLLLRVMLSLRLLVFNSLSYLRLFPLLNVPPPGQPPTRACGFQRWKPEKTNLSQQGL